MRILVHTIFYRPELTGVAKYTAEMCEWLAARGHEVRVVCPPPYYPRWKVQSPYRQWRFRREELEGVEVARCPIWIPGKPGGLQRGLYSLSFAVSSFVPVVRNIFWRPEVVFVIEPSLMNAFASWVLARFSGVLAWLHVQDFEIDLAFGLGQFRSARLERVLRAFESWMMR